MLRRGTRAPDFSLPGIADDAETPIERYELAEALSDGPAVLAFYLFDFHPECTEELCDLSNLSWFDLADGVSVFAISTDRSFSHRAFADAEGLDVPLLSDSDGSVADAFGVLYDEFNYHRRIAKRSVFVVDVDRTVRYAWSTDDPTTHPDWSAVEAAVRDIVRAGPNAGPVW